jgi:hypothetical protein
MPTIFNEITEELKECTKITKTNPFHTYCLSKNADLDLNIHYINSKKPG